MGKFGLVMVLLVVVFFGGLTYGSVDKQASQPNKREDIQALIDSQYVNEAVDILPAEYFYEEEAVADVVESERINQTASFFESIVKGLYEFIVDMLYSFANLFFE